jgi:carbon-monoxide dehydrogenase large subunit
MGIGISSFTEIVGAGPSHDFDILGLKMFDSCEIRVHPTGKVLARLGVQTQGQGHETTFAQIIAEELGFPVQDIKIEEGDTDTAPYGLGTYASRSTPVAGAATAVAARKIRDKARTIAAHLLEASEDDLEWEPGKFSVKGSPTGSRRSRRSRSRPTPTTRRDGGRSRGRRLLRSAEPDLPVRQLHLRRRHRQGHRQVHIRRFVAIDDCGNIINPMIVDGQIHGGLTMGLAPALYEQITYDELGNNLAGRSWTTCSRPRWRPRPGRRQDRRPIAAPPDRRQGRRRVGHGRRPPPSRTRSSTRMWHLGVRNIDIPITPQKVWAILHDKGRGLAAMPSRFDLRPGGELEDFRPLISPVATVVAVRRPTSGEAGRRRYLSIRTARSKLGRWQLRPAGRRTRGAAVARRRAAGGSCGCRRTAPAGGAFGPTASSSW